MSIDWYSHSGVDFYEYQLDTVNTFDSDVFYENVEAYINSSSSNSDTDEYIENLYFGKTYYWRVRAINAVDTSEWSAVRGFITIDYVSLNTPSNNGSVFTGMSIDWYSHSGVDFYEYQVDTVNTFDSDILIEDKNTYINSSSSNGDTEKYLENLYFGQTYYWRVRAINAVDTSEWETVRVFYTVDYVALNSPANNGSVFTGTTINWNSHSGIDFYEYQVDTTETFDSEVLIEGLEAYINSSSSNDDTDEYINDLYFGKTYYWRVRAINAVDTSEWETVRVFYTVDYVSLYTPANETLNINTSGTNLDWGSHYGVSFYDLEIDKTNQFNSPDLQEITKAYINSSSSNSDTYQHTGILDENTIYFWRVRAINAIDSSAWTTRWFSTGNAPLNLPETPILTSPTNNTTYLPTSFTFDWQDANNTSSYILQYADNNQFISAIQETSAVSEFAVSGLDENITYYWRVYSSDGTNISNWSDVWSFSTNTDVLDAPSLVSPVNEATNQSTSPILVWNSVMGATMYEYQYSTDEYFSTYANDYVSGTDATISGLNNNYTYYWRVSAFDGTDWSEWSEVWSFTTEEAGAGLSTPILISPTDNATNQVLSPTLLWNIVPTANEYEYQYSIDETFATYESGTTQSSSISIGVLDYNTEYFWRIQATDGTNFSEWSEIWSFTTEGNTNLSAPILISPSDNAINQSLSSSLNWNSVNNATEYEYQYSTDNTFSTFTAGITANTEILIDLDYSTEYFWRVQATDGTNFSEWSEIWSFTTEDDVNIYNIKNEEIYIYPNPASNYLYIFVNDNFIDNEITITDISGKTVYNSYLKNNKTQIDVNNLESGIYFVNIKTKTNIISRKIIIN